MGNQNKLTPCYGVDKYLAKPKKRLVKGRDWDKWAIKMPNGQYWNMTFSKRPDGIKLGEKVRVKFVEV